MAAKTRETAESVWDAVALVELPAKKYFKIGEVAALVGVEPHVLRYWQTQFRQVRPQKSRSGHRQYRRRDVENLLAIKELLHVQRFTIAGARQALKSAPSTLPRPASPDSTLPRAAESQLPQAADVADAPKNRSAQERSGQGSAHASASATARASAVAAPSALAPPTVTSSPVPPSETMHAAAPAAAAAPTAQAPTAQAPTAQAPTAQAPTAQAPTAQAPTTAAPGGREDVAAFEVIGVETDSQLRRALEGEYAEQVGAHARVEVQGEAPIPACPPSAASASAASAPASAGAPSGEERRLSTSPSLSNGSSEAANEGGRGNGPSSNSSPAPEVDLEVPRRRRSLVSQQLGFGFVPTAHEVLAAARREALDLLELLDREDASDRRHNHSKV